MQTETCYIKQHADGHFSTYSDIIINAPAELVWQIVSDFENMKNWSSTLVNITGELKDKGKVQSHFSFDGRIWLADHTFTYKEGEYFGWSDPLTDDFQGNQDNHLFKVEAISENQSRFVQTDEFTGENASKHSLTLARVAFDSYPKFNRELAEAVMKKHLGQ
ncbi:MAG: SRPBCC family protein [Capnocytophaga sp.]|nr:SRPBCC family protein [Capnocytophaga sp.]